MREKRPFNIIVKSDYFVVFEYEKEKRPLLIRDNERVWVVVEKKKRKFKENRSFVRLQVRRRRRRFFVSY